MTSRICLFALSALCAAATSPVLAQAVEAAPSAADVVVSPGVTLSDGRRFAPTLAPVAGCEAPVVKPTPGVTGLEYVCALAPLGDAVEGEVAPDAVTGAVVMLDAAQVEGSAMAFVLTQAESWWPDVVTTELPTKVTGTMRRTANGAIPLACVHRDDAATGQGHAVCVVHQPGLQVMIGARAARSDIADRGIDAMLMGATLDPSSPVASVVDDQAAAPGVAHQDIGQ